MEEERRHLHYISYPNIIATCTYWSTSRFNSRPRQLWLPKFSMLFYGALGRKCGWIFSQTGMQTNFETRQALYCIYFTLDLTSINIEKIVVCQQWFERTTLRVVSPQKCSNLGWNIGVMWFYKESFCYCQIFPLGVLYSPFICVLLDWHTLCNPGGASHIRDSVMWSITDFHGSGGPPGPVSTTLSSKGNCLTNGQNNILRCFYKLIKDFVP